MTKTTDETKSDRLLERMAEAGITIKLDVTGRSSVVGPPDVLEWWRDTIAHNAPYIKIALAYDKALAAWDAKDEAEARRWVRVMEKFQRGDNDNEN